MKYIYIICSGHSGSTLLDLVLSNAATVFSMGEIIRLEQALEKNTLCSCLSPVADCIVWRAILENFSADDIATYSYGARKQDLNDPSIKAAFIEKYPSFLKRIQSVTKSYACCDSSKSLDRLKLLTQVPNLDLRVIYLQRHGGGVVMSQMSKGRGFLQQSLVWLKRNFQILNYLKRYQVPWTCVIYETLALHPKASMNDLYHFLELDYEYSKINNFYKLRHLVEGNRIRFNHKKLVVKAPHNWDQEFNFLQNLYLNSIYHLLGVLMPASIPNNSIKRGD